MLSRSLKQFKPFGSPRCLRLSSSSRASLTWVFGLRSPRMLAHPEGSRCQAVSPGGTPGGHAPSVHQACCLLGTEFPAPARTASPMLGFSQAGTDASGRSSVFTLSTKTFTPPPPLQPSRSHDDPCKRGPLRSHLESCLFVWVGLNDDTGNVIYAFMI